MAKSAEEIRADLERLKAVKAQNLIGSKEDDSHGLPSGVMNPADQTNLPASTLAEPESFTRSTDRNRRVSGEARESATNKDGRPTPKQDSRGGQTSFERETRMQPDKLHAHQQKDRDEPRSPARNSLKSDDMPHSAEAEMGVLGSMLVEPRTAIPEAQQKVTADFFYVPRHMTIFNALTSMFEDEGAVDLITFTEYLRGVGQLDSVGGPGFVTELFCFVPTAANIQYYIEIVRDRYIQRQVITAAQASLNDAYQQQEDLGEMLAAHERRMEVVRTIAQVGHLRLPNLADASSYANGNCPEKPAELVSGVLHQGSKLIVGGTSKGRKTMALIDLAVSVATGASWWGFPCKKGPVCYINFEIQEAFFWDRVNTVCKAKGVTLEKDMFLAWNLRGHGEGIENLTDDLLAVLRHRRFVLDIIDPIYKALGKRDENKAGDVASMLNELEKIAVRTKAAVGFGAHYSKGNQALKESIDRIGGSGVFARDPDSILTMTAHEEEECFTVDCTLRNFAPMQPFVVQWKWPVFTRVDELDPCALKPARTNNTSGHFPTKYTKDQVTEYLSVIEGKRPGKLFKEVSEATGMSRAAFYRFASELRNANLLVERLGEWFRGNGKDQ